MSFQKNASAVRRYTWVMKFAAWLHSLPGRLTPPAFRLMQMGSAFWQSRALYVATRLNIATALGDDILDANTIAARLSAHPDATARLLRFLAAMGVFEETSPLTFRNNNLSAYLREDHPGNVRAMILMHNSDAMSRPWFEKLEDGIREGVSPFRLNYQEDLFTYLDHHPDFDALFSEAMDSVEALTGSSFATDFDWGRFDRLVDLGGSRGTKSLAILRRHPHLTAVVVDRPQVIQEAECYWATQCTEGLERLSFQAGNVLESIPRSENGKEIYLLAAVLHGFDDDGCIRILRNLAEAMGTTSARAVLLEVVMPDSHADAVIASLDMQMFMGTGGGRERTLVEWKSLMSRGDLELEEVVGLQSFGKMLVLRPKFQGIDGLSH